MQIGFVIINGPRRGEILQVEPGQRVRIGRDDDCAMQLPDAAVSRHHCEIWLDGALMVQDLGSSLGTLVNTELIDAPTQLSYNYDLQIGSTVLRVVNPASMPTMLPQPDDKDPLETLFETRIARDRQLGEVLVEQGATSHNHISQAIQKMTLQFRQKHKLPPDLGTVLVYHKVVSDEQLKEGLLELNRRRADARAATAKTAGMADEQQQEQLDMAAYASPESDHPLQKLQGDEGRFDYGGMSTGELVGQPSEDSMIEASYATSDYEPQPPTYEAEMPGGSWDESPAADAWGASEPEIQDAGTGSADWGMENEAAAGMPMGGAAMPMGGQPVPPPTQDMTRRPRRTQRVSAHDEMPVTLRDGELNSDEVDASLQQGIPIGQQDDQSRPSRLDRAKQGKGKKKGKERDENDPTERPRKYAHPINYLAAFLMAVAMLAPMARMDTTELQSWSETMTSTEGEAADVLKPTLVYYDPAPTEDAPADPMTNWLWMAAAGMVVLTLLGETFGFMRMRFMSFLYGLGAFAEVAWVLTMGFSETGLQMWQNVDGNAMMDIFSTWGLGMWALVGAGVVWMVGTVIRPKKALLSWIFAFLLAVGVIGWMVVTVLPGADAGSFMVLPIGGAS